MVGGVGRVVQVVGGGDLHRFLHIVGVVQDQAQQRGGGEVRLVGVLAGGDGLLAALVGHVDAAAHARVVDAVQRRVGGRQADDLVHQAFHVLVHVDAQELQVHRGDGGVAALVLLGKDQHGVGLGEVVVAGEQAVAVLGRGREGGAADLRRADLEVHHPVGDVAGDELDQFVVVADAALGHKIVQIEAALDMHRIDRAIQMVIVAVAQHLDAGDRADLIVPHSIDSGGGQHEQKRDDGQHRQQDLFQTEFFLGFHCVHGEIPFFFSFA